MNGHLQDPAPDCIAKRVQSIPGIDLVEALTTLAVDRIPIINSPEKPATDRFIGHSLSCARSAQRDPTARSMPVSGSASTAALTAYRTFAAPQKGVLDRLPKRPEQVEIAPTSGIEAWGFEQGLLDVLCKSCAIEQQLLNRSLTASTAAKALR